MQIHNDQITKIKKNTFTKDSYSIKAVDTTKKNILGTTKATQYHGDAAGNVNKKSSVKTNILGNTTATTMQRGTNGELLIQRMCTHPQIRIQFPVI
ncbi:MAG: hypothetical protein ABIQ95_12970 [Bdellovibrionia bacterium]